MLGLIVETEFEIVIGVDRIVRINVDGICALRARLKPDAAYVVRDYTKPDDPLEAA